MRKKNFITILREPRSLTIWGFFSQNENWKFHEYLLSIAEIVKSVQQIGAEILLIVHNYILGLILGLIESIYVFVSHSKDEKDKFLSSGTAAKT